MTITRDHTIASRSDEHGNPVSGTAESVALYDQTIDRLARFDVDVLTLVGRLTEDHPDFPMGHAVAAYLSLNSTDAAELPTVPGPGREHRQDQPLATTTERRPGRARCVAHPHLTQHPHPHGPDSTNWAGAADPNGRGSTRTC